MDAAAGDGFGRSVSQSAESAIISAPLDADAGANTGSAYVFVRSGTTWTEQQKLTAMDAAANDYFGLSVSLSGDTALVGAQGDDDGGSNTGSAYVFVRSGTTWTPEQKLNASDPGAEDQFGYSVSVDGDTALVGAPTHDDGGMDTGSAYVFVRSGTTWTEEQKLGPSNPATIDNFGYSVSLSGDTALVGAIRYMGIGSAYVLVRSGTTWTEDQEVAASDGEQANLFGYSVSLSGDTALVGAQGHDHGAGAKSGAAFAFTLLGIPCTQDSDCDSGFCRDGVCCDSDCSGTCEVCSAANGASDDGLCTELAMPCGGGGAGGSAPGTGGAPTTSSSSSGFGGAPEREVPPQDDCDCSFPGAPLGGSASRLGALAALALLTLQRRRRRGRSRRGGHPPS
jgi:hypothetical protein